MINTMYNRCSCQHIVILYMRALWRLGHIILYTQCDSRLRSVQVTGRLRAKHWKDPPNHPTDNEMSAKYTFSLSRTLAKHKVKRILVKLCSMILKLSYDEITRGFDISKVIFFILQWFDFILDLKIKKPGKLLCCTAGYSGSL